MARKFTRLRSVRKSYAEQGLIFFTCLSYSSQPKNIQEKICRLCQTAGGEYESALFEYLTTSADWLDVTMRYHLSDRTLERCQNKFYSLW